MYYLQACMRAPFSPEILPAGAVKGLIKGHFDSLLPILKRNFHAQCENRKGEAEVLVHGYA